jgi:Rieske Fe-S protein
VFNELSVDDRRDFLKKSLLGIGVVLCGSTLSSLVTACSSSTGPSVVGGTATFNITTVPQLLNIGGAVKKTFSGQFANKPVLIIRLDTTTFVSFTTVCPHEGSEVSVPSSPTSNIICRAHGSEFSQADGSVRKGPASSNLTKFNSVFDSASNKLTVSY